jgi:hypothetical protein
MTDFQAAAVDLTVLVPLASAFVAGFFAWYVKAWQVDKEAEDKALQALRRYRDPLLRAAFDLQSRLYNIAAKEFLGRYWKQGNEEQREYARLSTLWLFGQYLGWVEILRREVQYLDLGSRSANQELQRRLNQVSAALASDAQGRSEFIVFRSDQRAIGEFMVIERSGQDENRPDCLGYSEFSGKLAAIEAETAGAATPSEFSVILGWVDRFTRDLEELGKSSRLDPHVRLAKVQRGLVDLVDLLDADRVRYPYLNLRGRLPKGGLGERDDRDEVAYFVWPWSDPWDQVDAWAGERSMRCFGETPSEKRFCSRKGLLGRRLEVSVLCDRNMVWVKAGMVRSSGAEPLNGSLRSRRYRLIVNDLLKRFERPLLQGQGTLPDRVYAWALRRP